MHNDKYVYRGMVLYTVVSLLEVPYLIEAPPKGSAICHKIEVLQ